jgi:hypothetical protein
MESAALLSELQEAGFTVVLDPPDGILVAPADRLTVELSSAIRANKPLLLAALRPPVEPPARPSRATLPGQCWVCKGANFWTRPLEHGGGPVCSRCQPNPVDLLAEWERRHEAAQEVTPVDPNRAALLEWALAHGCPELRIRPWATVVGTAHGWRGFVITATEDDITAALVAAGVEVDSLAHHRAQGRNTGERAEHGEAVANARDGP